MPRILLAGGTFGLGTAWGSWYHHDVIPILAISLAMIILAWLWSDLFERE